LVREWLQECHSSQLHSERLWLRALLRMVALAGVHTLQAHTSWVPATRAGGLLRMVSPPTTSVVLGILR
jgi:hypothetical protein